MEAIVMPVTWEMWPNAARPVFQAFRSPAGEQMILEQNAFVEQVLPGGIVRSLSAQEMDAYRAPFARPDDRAPIWRWPNEIPIEGEPADVTVAVTAYNEWLQQTEIPKLMFHATPGALIPPPIVAWCQASLPNLTSVDLGRGIHFLAEDHPHRIGEGLARWLGQLESARHPG